MTWADKSADWLQEQIKTHTDMDKKQLQTWCKKHYPFAQRSGFAYKAWLSVMRAYFNPQAVRPIVNGKRYLSCQELEKLGQQRLID